MAIYLVRKGKLIIEKERGRCRGLKKKKNKIEEKTKRRERKEEREKDIMI